VPEPDVDLIIAVHDPTRPIERAVSSVLDGTRAAVRVTVVCHNTDGTAIRVRLESHSQDARLRVLDLVDGVASPSGPFNAGLDAATASYVSIMGSDDELRPGAVDSWLAVARASESDVVLPPIVHASGARVPTPPSRPFRSRRLDGVKDRLAYRSAPLGLIARSRIGAIRFPAAVPTGEDIEFTVALWFSGAVVAFDRRGPAYVVHADADERVSTIRRPIAIDASFLEPLLRSAAFLGLSVIQRTALVVKLYRINILAWAANRPEVDAWSDQDRVDLAECIAACRAVAPRAEEMLSRADRDLIDAICDPSSPTQTVVDLARARRIHARFAALVPRGPSDILRREAPLRFVAASAIMRAG
jgi:hypothetical protein